METLHPQFIEKDGKKEFVILPVAEYEKISELLEDYEDLMELREIKKESNKKYSHEEIKKILGSIK